MIRTCIYLFKIKNPTGYGGQTFMARYTDIYKLAKLE